MNDDWAPVFEGPSFHCEIVRSALEAQGIEVLTPPGAPEFPGSAFDTSAVWVRKEEARRARDIIEAAERGEPPAGG